MTIITITSFMNNLCFNYQVSLLSCYIPYSASQLKTFNYQEKQHVQEDTKRSSPLFYSRENWEVYKKAITQAENLSNITKIETGSLIKIENAHEYLRFSTEGLNFNASAAGNNDTRIPLNKVCERSFSKKEEDFKRYSSPNQITKSQISAILELFTENFGKMTEHEIAKERIKHASNDILDQLFDLLSQRYSSAAKRREEMVRLAIRKAITFMIKQIKNEHKFNSKQATLAFCKKHFLQTADKCEFKIDQMGDRVLELFLPYKKNSRNKTPNSRFIEEAFLSEDFFKSYIMFLSKFDEIMKIDYQKKMAKLINFIYDCIANQNLGKIKTYKRLPWLNVWVESTKVIAYEILEKNIQTKGLGVESETFKKKKL